MNFEANDDKHEKFMTEYESNENNDSESVANKLNNAIEKLNNGDYGAHWESEVIEAASYLFQYDKPEFHRVRSKIKSVGQQAQISEWIKEVKCGVNNSSEDTTKAGDLVTLVTEISEVFHNNKNECFITFDNNGHKETWALGSIGFSDWLCFKAYSELGFSPSEVAIKQTITSLSGIAKYEGQEREVYLRCAPCNDGYIIDLSNEQWQAVKVTSNGWQIINKPDVRFIRSCTSKALDTPTKGNLKLLWQYANIPEKDQPLVLAFLLESWRADTPFTILILTGEQGAAKSSTHQCLRQLSDPNNVPLRSAPKTVEDVYVSAANNWQSSFENMSNLPNGMQDALCTLVTGGGFASRKLYSDNDESVIEVKRPVIINGIDNVATRPDLIDRSIVLNLPKIDEENKKKDAELKQGFIKDAPAIFAGLLDLFSETLRVLPSIDIKKPPRMMDFAYLGEAMLSTMGNESFNELYKLNRKDSLSHSLDSSPAALAVLEFMRKRVAEWEGTLKELKYVLEEDHHQEGDGWPKSPKGLSSVLKRTAPALREQGIYVEFTGHKRDGWHIKIYSTEALFESRNNSHKDHTVTKTHKNVSNLEKPPIESDRVTDVMADSEKNKMSDEDEWVNI